MSKSIKTTKTEQSRTTKIKNLGGRPSLITQVQVLEIARIKGEYGILTWQQAIILSLEIHPDWKLPHYKNCMIHINRLFLGMVELTNQKLAQNREDNLKKLKS